MPSGYTDQISKGITFEQYALSCARAFGACAEMRDEPFDKAIPAEFKPSTYHKDEFIKSQNELMKLEKMTIKEASALAKQDKDKSVMYNTETIKEKTKLLDKYVKMLTKVEMWNSPSKDHDEFKKFMREQIKQSIEYDCNTKYYEESVAKPLTGKEWLKLRIADAKKEIKYHAEEYVKAVKSAESRTKWVNLLRESIKGNA
jgi:hypothetical protein